MSHHAQVLSLALSRGPPPAQVPVVCEISPLRRIVLIKFPGYVQPGLYGRISRKELSEWHVFGCFSEHYTLDHHFMICSVVGGFTRGLAENPPTHLYVRWGQPFVFIQPRRPVQLNVVM